MADISKIKLPNGTTYDIKDAVARAKFPVAVTDGGTGMTSALEGFWNLENRGYNADANAALSVGLYNTNTSTQNLPSLAYSQGNGCGILLVYVSNASTHNNSNNWIWQMWLNTTTTELFIRKKVNTGSWGEWCTSLDAIRSNQYYEAATPAYGINLNNSDIIGVNSIYTNDFADNAKEGIQFLRSATTADSLWARSGTLYFTPARTLGQSTGPQGDLPLYTIPWYGTGTTDLSIRPYIAFARANRLAFLPADQIIIEETTDGGQTWTSGGYTDASKQSLFATRGASIRIPLLNGAKSTNCGVRITITGMKYNVPDGTSETEKYNYWNAEYVKSTERYCNLREMWFWMSTNTDTVRCQVYRATGANPNIWRECFNTDFGMTGWAGSDWVRFDGNWRFGGGTTQTGNFWNWRIIFWSRMVDGKDTFNSNTLQTISGINGYGDNVWTTPNGLMKEDHLYTWDVNMNAAFPARVQASSFKGIGEELTALNGSNITSGTVAEARIAALSAGKITSGTFDVARIPALSADKITSGTLNTDRIPALGAAKITSGTFDAARIPNLDAGKITSGTIASDRLPVLEGATEENNGTSGIVPAPTTEDKNYFLKGDGTWSALTAPIDTRIYTNVIATANNNQGGGFFYLKVRGDTYNTKWYIKTRVLATVPGQELYETDSIFELWGYANTYSGYACMNKIKTTSYRPIYYNSYFRVSETGYNNNCGGWIGFNLIYATNNTNTSYKRNIVVELLDYQNCEVELQDDLIMPDNIPERATHTNWYSSTNTSYDNFDACTQGLRQPGDSNTTSISNLYYANGNYIADSPLYKYQLLFHVDDDRLTPLNNDNNVLGTTKTILTDVEFNPFKDIFYYYSTTTVNKDAGIAAGSLFYSWGALDLRYSFNITTSAFTIHKDVYLVVTPTTNNKVKLASANPLTQELPISDDGYWYLLLGRTYNAYCISLHPKHPIYAYKDGKIVTINPSDIYFNDTEIKPLSKKVNSTNIIHIEDAAAKPLKECKIDIQPVQDLHGYEHPWPGGGTKNKMPNAIPKTETINGITFKLDDFGVFTVTGTATAAARCDFPIGFSFVIPDGDPKPKFVLNNTQAVSSAVFHFFNDSSEVDYWTIQPVNRVSEYSSMRGKTCNSYRITIPSGTTVNMTISPMIIESSVTDYTYTPYSNICPITGWTGAKVTRTGKNLLNPSILFASGNNVKTKTGEYVQLKKNVEYYYCSTIPIDGLYISDKSNNELAYIYNNQRLKYTPTEDVEVALNAYWTNDKLPSGGLSVDMIYICVGSDSGYEPYQGDTYDITFPSEAGTVYGGSLDVTNGVLTINRATVDLGTLTWKWNNANGWIAPFSGGLKPMVNNNVAMNAICSTMPVVSKVENNNIVTAGTNLDTIAATWQGTYLYGSNANAMPTGILVYELATPVTYNLTPQEITTLLGTNNIWADTGNISCTYYVNSQLNTELNNYIPKSLGTTKGDIIYYSDNNTPNRLGIGNEGQVLKVSSNGIPAWDTDNSNSDTTYTFTGGTNQFTATSSDGTIQTVNVTPQVPNASTSTAGIVQLNTATNSTSTTQAATPSAVKSAYDLAASKTSNTGTVTSVTLTAGNGISITDNSVPITTIGGRTITNTGVTSVSQGTTNGTINVTTNGSTSAVAIRGLGSAAYTASTAYATAAQGGKADAAMPKSGGTFTGAVTLHANPTSNLMAATKQYVDNNVRISDNLSSGTKIATITINGINTDLYSPGTPQTISVTQSSSTPTLEFITSTNSSNSSTLTGVTTTALANGKMIVYRLAYALTGSPVTLTLSNTSGTSLGNYPVYIDGTTQCSDIYRAGTMLFLVFYNNKFTIVNPFGLAG